MMQDLQVNARAHLEKGYPKVKAHYLLGVEDDYEKELANISDVKPIPDIYLKIGNHLLKQVLEQPTEFRKYKYTVIDEDNFDCARFEN